MGTIISSRAGIEGDAARNESLSETVRTAHAVELRRRRVDHGAAVEEDRLDELGLALLADPAGWLDPVGLRDEVVERLATPLPPLEPIDRMVRTSRIGREPRSGP